MICNFLARLSTGDWRLSARRAETEEKKNRSGEQRRRGIKARCGPGEVNRSNRAPEDGCDRVTRAVQQVDSGIKIGQRPQPLRISKRKGRKKQKDKIRNDKPDQPFAKLERGHREPGELRANRQNRRVVDAQETRQRFVRYVRGKRETQQEPGKPEIALCGRIALLRHEAHISSFLSVEQGPWPVDEHGVLVIY